MHRLFLGLNLWSAAFVMFAALLGWSGSPYHLRAGIFATVFACLVQSGVIALFMGAAKLAKEHVGRFNLPLSLIDRINVIYHRIFPTAGCSATLMGAAAIAGGLSGVGQAPLWLHHGVAIVSATWLIAAIPREFRLQRAMHGIILDIEKLLPAPEEAAAAEPHPAYKADVVVMDRGGRRKAMLYIGLTLPLPYLGYTWISGRDVSFFLVPTMVGTLFCLAGAAWLSRARKRVGGK